MEQGARPEAQVDAGARSAADLDAVLALVARLRRDGVAAVAGPAAALARPAGTDLLPVLALLLAEIAREWRTASHALPVLHSGRLQLQSAAALLDQACAAASTLPGRARPIPGDELARAVALRAAVLAPDDGRTLEEGNLLLDRTWTVLGDLRNHAAPVEVAVVQAGVWTDGDQARLLPPALQEEAATGALVGLLAPWLPPPAADPLAVVDRLMNAVSALARHQQDDPWWVAMTRVGRAAAHLVVASAFGTAVHDGSEPDAVAAVVGERAVAALIAGALTAAAQVAPELDIDREPAPTTRAAVSAGFPQQTPAAPQPSPTQQARAAAERAAAERAATQQAFMERASATRAARATQHDAPLVADVPADPVSVPLRDQGGVTSQLPSQPLRSHSSLIPRLPEVQDDLGEDGEDGEQLEPINLGVWDTLMSPRRPADGAR